MNASLFQGFLLFPSSSLDTLLDLLTDWLTCSRGIIFLNVFMYDVCIRTHNLSTMIIMMMTWHDYKFLFIIHSKAIVMIGGIRVHGTLCLLGSLFLSSSCWTMMRDWLLYIFIPLHTHTQENYLLNILIYFFSMYRSGLSKQPDLIVLCCLRCTK